MLTCEDSNKTLIFGFSHNYGYGMWLLGENREKIHLHVKMK